MRPALVVFAKSPTPGAVKTRLVPPLSSQEAADLYGCMLDDVLHATADTARALGVDALLAALPPEAAPELARRAPSPIRVVGQRGADLAARMSWAVAEAAAGGASPVLLRGSDSPALDPGVLARALEAFAQADLVVSPDLDGGYNLVGVRRPSAGLFDHPMSTPSALADTLANAARLGLRTAVLEPAFDIDTVDDLAHLWPIRAGIGTSSCARTLSFLEEHDLWRHVPVNAHAPGND